MPSFRYIDRRSSNESLENEVVVFGAEEQNDEKGGKREREERGRKKKAKARW